MKRILFLMLGLLIVAFATPATAQFKCSTDTVFSMYFPVNGDTVDLTGAPSGFTVFEGAVALGPSPVFYWASEDRKFWYATNLHWNEARALAALKWFPKACFDYNSIMSPGLYSLSRLSGYLGSADGVVLRIAKFY